MDFKVFEKIINELKNLSEQKSILSKNGLDIYYFSDKYEYIISLFFKTYYGAEGDDIIGWWLYEDVDKYIYFGKKKTDLTSVKALWKYVEKIRLSKDFKPYTMPKPMTDKQRKSMLNNIFMINGKTA